MILVDSCVVIDVLENDRRWAGWSQAQLETWSAMKPPWYYFQYLW